MRWMECLAISDAKTYGKKLRAAKLGSLRLLKGERSSQPPSVAYGLHISPKLCALTTHL